MKRTEVTKRIRRIARNKGAEVAFIEGGSHVKVTFDGRFVTTIPRHREINEHTAEAPSATPKLGSPEHAIPSSHRP